MSVLPSAGPARRRTLTPYVLLWMALAGLSLAYLTFLGVRPDVVAALRAARPDPEQALNETKQSVERVLADLDPLRQSVGEMKSDVAGLKMSAQEAADRDRILLEKVEALEHSAPAKAESAQAGKSPAIASAPPSPQPAAKKSAAAKVPPAPSIIASVAPIAAEPQVAQKPVAAEPAAEKPATAIETGSIARGAKTAAAATKPPPVGILLATGPSVDALRLSWTILSDRHADAVQSLHPRYVVSGKPDERTYGLVAGPFETIADAKAVCKTIADRGMPCELSSYRGTAF